MKPIKKEKPRAKSKLKTRSTKISPRKKTPDFNIQESQLKQVIKEEFESDPALLSAFERLIGKLDDLDSSIDYLAAAMTGVTPAEIELSQTALGRLAGPGAIEPR